MGNIKAIAALAAGLSCSLATAQQQGVTHNEILIGTIQDLSGPVAAQGKLARNGMQLRIEEINEQGGVHGRKLRMIVEDHGYDIRKAVLAAQKLATQDKIFIMAGHLGTPTNMAAMPVLFQRNIVNFYPLSSGREMFEPLHRLKYSFAATYYDQIRLALPKLSRENNSKRICLLHQDDDYGMEVKQGTEAGLRAMGAELVERTTYKRGATDFSSQMTRLKSAECDFVVLGSTIRETVGSMAEAQKIGFTPVFLSTAAAYIDVVPKLGGKAVEGLYVAMTTQMPYLDEASQPIRFWANKFKTRFGEDPNVFSVYGYMLIDHLIRASEKAGRNLTTDSFIKAMDSMTFEPDFFGSAHFTYSATKRLGSDQARLSQIQNGRWKVVSDYLK